MGIYDQSGLGKLWILYWCWPAFHASSAVLEEPGLALTKRAHLIFLWQSMHGQKLRYNYVSVWYQFIFIIYQKLKQNFLKNSLFKKKKKKTNLFVFWLKVETKNKNKQKAKNWLTLLPSDTLSAAHDIGKTWSFFNTKYGRAKSEIDPSHVGWGNSTCGLSACIMCSLNIYNYKLYFVNMPEFSLVNLYIHKTLAKRVLLHLPLADCEDRKSVV